MALIALGIGTGDEVIVPSFTFAATANAVALAGATPVFVDIEPDSFCISPESIEAAITIRTRAVIPVHLYGHPAAMDRITPIAAAHDLLVVEDAAQAHAASLHGAPVGALGDAGCFSFYPTKNMTSGEGGMVSAAAPRTARMVRLLRNQGMEVRYRNEVVGFNTRMSDIHAAIGRVQLGKLAGWTSQRQANAAFLTANLEGVVTPSVSKGAVHVYHQYTIRVPGHDQGAFVAALAERGVGSGVYYPTPVHALPSFGLTLDLPETAKAAMEVISLPVHPSLDSSDLDTIVEAVNAVARAGA
jgi:dTDP-4-amino-4,6-dideoxygalactose transaminase